MHFFFKISIVIFLLTSFESYAAPSNSYTSSINVCDSTSSMSTSTITNRDSCVDYSKGFTFAVLADTHQGSFDYAKKDLINSINDINNNPNIQLVVIAGDITEFGTDNEILQSRERLYGRVRSQKEENLLGLQMIRKFSL